MTQRTDTQPRNTALSRLLLSALLAIGLWSWVTVSRDPERTRSFPDVQVTAENLSSDLVIVGDLPRVTARYRGTRSETQELTAAQVRARVDLSGVDATGIYRLPIAVDRPEDIWSVSSTPETATVAVEALTSKVLPVDVEVSSALGTNQQVGSVSPSASEVVVTGPSSLVERATSARVPVDIGSNTTDFRGTFSAIAVDINGAAIPELEVNPDTISVLVEITARGRRVAVIAQISGNPAPGYEVVDRALNPSTVLVDGPPELIQDMITVETEPIDVSGATENVTERVAITGLPEGVRLIEPLSGRIDVVVQVRQQGIQQPLPSQEVTLINLAPGLRAAVTPDTVLVTVIASEQDLAALESDSLTVIVDVSGLGPGTYELQPRVVVPSNVEWLSIDPLMVTVVIEGEGAAASPVAAVVRPSPSPEN